MNKRHWNLFKLLAPHWKSFSLAMVALLLGSGINLFFPELIRRLFQPEYIELLRSSPLLIGGVLLSLFALQGLSFYFRSYLFNAIGLKIVSSLREKLFNVLLYQPVSFFDRERTGDLISRLSSDTLQLQDAVSIKISVLLRYSIQVIIGIALMLYLSIKLSIAILVSLPIIVLISLYYGKKLKNLSKAQSTALAQSSAIAEEGLSSIRVVKSFVQETTEHLRYQGANKATLQSGLARSKLAAFFSSFVSFLMNSAILIVILYGVVLVNRGSLSLGDLTAFLMYGVIVAVSFAFVGGAYGEYIQALGASERVFELLDHPVEKDAPDAIAPQHPLALHFEKVGFAYPGREENLILSNLSFQIPDGKVTALVGPSGAGKSSIIQLLLKFYEPTTGAIFSSSTPYHKLSLKNLRERIGYVPQDSILFATSIAENLRYGKLDATDEELREICRRVNLLSFIEGLPEKFETLIGERGVKLSGGQKQRLAIARALLKNPELLLLDEATSALDSENEALIQESFKELLPGKTVLVIAHRLSTVREADQILVIDQGQIIQQGTHQNLLSHAGLYKEMVERQDLGALR